MKTAHEIVKSINESKRAYVAASGRTPNRLGIHAVYLEVLVNDPVTSTFIGISKANGHTYDGMKIVLLESPEWFTFWVVE